MQLTLSSASSSSNVRYGRNLNLNCYCGAPAKYGVSKTTRRGVLYYGCQQWPNGCSFSHGKMNLWGGFLIIQDDVLPEIDFVLAASHPGVVYHPVHDLHTLAYATPSKTISPRSNVDINLSIYRWDTHG